MQKHTTAVYVVPGRREYTDIFKSAAADIYVEKLELYCTYRRFRTCLESFQLFPDSEEGVSDRQWSVP